jgi:hypothetical protein
MTITTMIILPTTLIPLRRRHQPRPLRLHNLRLRRRQKKLRRL